MFSGFRLQTPPYGGINLLSCLPVRLRPEALRARDYAETVAFKISPLHPDREAHRDKWSLALIAHASGQRDIRLQRRNRVRFSRTSILLSTSKKYKEQSDCLFVYKDYPELSRTFFSFVLVFCSEI